MHETFIGGIRRNENGPYEVKLPFKNDHPLLPDKFTLCKSHLENRLKTLKNSSLRKDRNSFPRTKQPGIIEKADIIQTEIGKTHCLSHHAVLRGENVPSVRSFRYILQGPKGHILGQGVVDKLTKLSKIDFSVECFTAYFFFFFRFFTEKCQSLTFGWVSGNSPSNPSIPGFFLKFSIYFFLVWAQNSAQR